MTYLRYILLGLLLLAFACQSSDENDEETQQNVEVTEEDEGIHPGLSVDLPEIGEVDYEEEEPRRVDFEAPKEQEIAEEADLPRPSVAVPDFRNVPAGDERRNLFVQFLTPIIEAENAKIERKRYLIAQKYRGVQDGGELSEEDEQWLKDLARKYRTKNRDFPSDEAFRDLFMHVDIIPVPLAIVQAANETAWGTSRFARLGNNFFGKWCFTQGCGIVPAARSAGATHEVQVYPTVAESTADYMHHVNSHPGYYELRERRYNQRLNNEEPDGHHIAVGLKNYSAIGMEYVNILRNMMDRLPS